MEQWKVAEHGGLLYLRRSVDQLSLMYSVVTYELCVEPATKRDFRDIFPDTKGPEYHPVMGESRYEADDFLNCDPAIWGVFVEIDVFIGQSDGLRNLGFEYATCTLSFRHCVGPNHIQTRIVCDDQVTDQIDKSHEQIGYDCEMI